MSLGAVIGAILVARYLLRQASGGGAEREDARSTGVLRIIVWMLVGPLGLLAAGLLAAGRLAFLPIVLGAIVLLFPWPIVRYVLVPLGRPWLAFIVGQLSGSLYRRDLRGGGLVGAAWALLRRRRVTPGQLDWLERRLQRARPLRGAGVVASGLLAARRGDLIGARALLRAVGTMDPRVLPDAARRLAADWLIGDAAARGDWDEVARLGCSGRAARGARALTAAGSSGRSARARFLGAVAMRLLHGAEIIARDPEAGDILLRGLMRLGEGAPEDRLLWARWVLCGCPRDLLPLLQRARQPGPLGPERQLGAGPAPHGRPDALSAALSQHAALLRRPAHERDLAAVIALGARWEAALADSAVQRQAIERGLVLGVTDSRQALGALRTAAVEALRAMARASGLDLSEASGALVQEAAAGLRHELCSEVELLCDALRARVDARRALPMLDEWREWAMLRSLHGRAVRGGGERLRYLVWPKVHPDVCEWAVWLWNERKEYVLANTIFRWLLHQAEILQDEKALELQRKNVKANL